MVPCVVFGVETDTWADLALEEVSLVERRSPENLDVLDWYRRNALARWLHIDDHWFGPGAVEHVVMHFEAE